MTSDNDIDIEKEKADDDDDSDDDDENERTNTEFYSDLRRARLRMQELEFVPKEVSVSFFFLIYIFYHATLI